MNIHYYGTSAIHRIIAPKSHCDYYKSKEDCIAAIDWAEDFQIHEVDLDDPEFILKDVPEEFKSVFSSYAWDRGHSYGKEEVTLHLHDLVSEFLPAILKYGERISLQGNK